MSGSRAVPRNIVGGLLLVGGAWFLVAVFRPEPPPAPAKYWTSSQQCQECHAQVYDEWSGSQHAMSWINPEVRAQSKDFANTDCIDCHAPQPVFEVGVGERILPRASRRVEGVDCIACHQVPAEDGTVHMAGTMERESAACRPIEKRELTRPEFCAGCHDQHETVRQWRASEWPERGFDCLSCHMPERPDGSGRFHMMHGGKSHEMLRSAVELRGAREDGVWVVEVENTGTGHSFPTDERSRAADVFWRPLGETEASAWRHAYRFRSPYRWETDIPDTLLLAHATQRIPLEGPGSDGPVEVALFYKRSPYYENPDVPDPENEAVLVHRLELTP